MAQELKALPGLLEEMGLNHSTVGSQLSVTLVLRESNVLFWPLWASDTQVSTQLNVQAKQPYLQNKNNFKNPIEIDTVHFLTLKIRWSGLYKH